MKKYPVIIFLMIVSVSWVMGQGSITVNSPNGGEKWILGSTHDITWEASGITNMFKITLWKDGVDKGIIADNISKSARSYPWTVGQYSGGTAQTGSGYTIKIREKSLAPNDFSDQPFEIIKSLPRIARPKDLNKPFPPRPFITVTFPHKNDKLMWRIGSTNTIKWNHSSSITANVKIELWVVSTNQLGTVIVNNWPINQDFAWEIPFGLNCTYYRIKVKTVNNKFEDFSDVFKIHEYSAPDLR